MHIIDNSSLSCDAKTGIYSLNENINMEANLTLNTDKKKKPKLIYYYDALCGWCYGFSPVISQLHQEFTGRLDFEIISGGLFLKNRAGFVNDVAPHIKAGAYKSVEARTGVKFGETFLADVFGKGKMTLNSLPPSIALCIVKEQFPDKGLEFAEILLSAVYLDGMNPIIVEEYKKYVDKIGFDFEDFSKKMKDYKYKEMAENEFEIFKESQLSGMPTLVIEKNGQQIILSNGYLGYNELKIRINKVLE